MNNKEALKEDIQNIFYGTPEDIENRTSLEPNDRVVKELMELNKKDAIAFAEFSVERNLEISLGILVDNEGTYNSMEQYYELYQLSLNK